MILFRRWRYKRAFMKGYRVAKADMRLEFSAGFQITQLANVVRIKYGSIQAFAEASEEDQNLELLRIMKIAKALDGLDHGQSLGANLCLMWLSSIVMNDKKLTDFYQLKLVDLCKRTDPLFE